MKIGNIQYSTIFQCLIKYRKTIFTTLVFLSLLAIPSPGLYAQEPVPADTLKKKKEPRAVDTARIKKHSPHKATLYSMILPGLGQAYNKKYWKIPIVYAGFGVFYYLIDYNNTEYQKWRAAYNHAVSDPDGEEDPVNDYEEYYGDNPDFLRDRKNDARRYRDLNYILAGVWYMLNVLDATVDAHLFSWEVDENLSLRMEPHLQSQMGSYKPMGGVRLSLRF
jgi:hypothetical protein